MSIPPRLRAAGRPVLAIAVCVVLAGLADEWSLRTWQRSGTGDEAVARVAGFDAPVLERRGETRDPHSRSYFRSQIAVVQPLFGLRAGRVLASRVLLGPNPSSNLVLRRGMLVQISVGEGTADAKLLKPALRYRWSLVAMLVLAATLIVAGGRVGLRVLAVIAAAAALMLGGLVPLLARGWSPLPTTGLFCLAMLGAVFAISGAVDRRAFAAIAGCAVGLAVAAALLVASSWWLGFSGTESVTARFLEWVESQVSASYDYRGLLAAGLLVALFGLAMDTSVTVAAGVAQVYAARPDIPRHEATASGMNIAGDVVGTMVLTLVFAFVGLRLPVLLLPHALGASPAELINSEAGASEVLHVLVGAIALTATGPATALIAPLLLTGRRAEAAAKPERRPSRRSTRALAALALVGVGVGAILWSHLRVEWTAWPRERQERRRPRALIVLARNALRRQAVGQAVLTLWEAREGYPDDARVRTELAYAFMSQRWLVQARREIDAALDAGADDAQTHYVAGVVRAWAGRHDEAERHLRRAVELDANHQAARAALEQLFGTTPDQEAQP